VYDVAIIGGGPTGSRLAYKLALMGHRVIIIEHKESLGELVCCTGIISQECVDAFLIDDSVIFRQVNSARIFSPSGSELKLWRKKPQACIVDRPAFNMALARLAQDKGVEYVLNNPARNIEVYSDRVRIEAGSEERGLNLFEARAAVIATGFNSKLTEKCGLGRFGDFVMGAQAEVEATGANEVEVYLGREVSSAFFGWLVPTSKDRALVGLLSRHQPGIYLRKLISSLYTQGKITSMDADLSYGGVPLKPLKKTYSDRLIVVGTAAGQVKPITGGGVYYGLLCADIAADNLHRALISNALSAKSLAGYQRRWKRKLGHELKLGYLARKIYELMNDKQVDRIFDVIKSNGIDEALLKADDLSFDWHGPVVLRLLGQQAFSKAIQRFKLPLGKTGPRELDIINMRSHEDE